MHMEKTHLSLLFASSQLLPCAL